MKFDPHSFAEPQNASFSHVSLDISVDFENQQLRCVATYQLLLTSRSSEIIFDTNHLQVLEIACDGKKVAHKLGANDAILGAPLTVSLPKNAQSLTIQYVTHPKAAALQWLNAVQTADKTHPFLFTQSQAILARSWVPCQDSPGIRFTYDATIRVPKGMRAIASANLVKAEMENGVFFFQQDKPISSYLLALAVGNLEYRAVGDRTGVYAEPSQINAVLHEFMDMEKMLVAAEQLYGNYRWNRYEVLVCPPSFPFGGMENPVVTFATPTIIVGDRSLTSLVAHELAHSWSGNLVTNETWNDFWLNEGFTVYFERRIMEAIYGEDYSDMLAQLGYQDLQHILDLLGRDNKDTQLKLKLDGRDPDDGMNPIAYEKGYFLLLLIEKTVGKRRFDKFILQYFSTHAFQSMNTENFIEYLRIHLLNEQPNWEKQIHLEEWIYQPGLPSNCPQIHSKLFAKVEETVQKWLSGADAKSLSTQDWSTHEWLHCLRSMPASLSLQQIEALDEAFSFTTSNNAEIQCEWYVRCIQSNYQQAFPAIEKFLCSVGRRKFLMPVYRALEKTESGLAFAKQVYQKARPNYHFVAQNTFDATLL